MQEQQWNDYWKSYSKRSYKHLTFFVVVVVAIAVFSAYYTLYPTHKEPITREEIPQEPAEPATQPEIPAREQQPATPKGELVIAVKDERQKLSQVGLGEATELFFTINSIQIINTTETLEKRSVIDPQWVTLFEGEKIFDLLKYTDQSALISDSFVEAGNYSQIRVYVSGPSIRIDNPEFQIFGKVYPMYMNSNVLKITRPFTVDQGRTTVITLDFDVPKIVSRTAQGYTLGPVFKPISDEINVKEEKFERGVRPDNVVPV